ncbi:MAG: hypothetical protein WCE81_13345 [Halobacteriota archaeon]
MEKVRGLAKRSDPPTLWRTPLALYYTKAVIAEGKATVKLPDQLLAIVKRNKKQIVSSS